MRPRSRAGSWLLDRGGLLALLALVVYSWLASPHIVGNDNAEFSTLGAVGGIAHPSGYPGYVLWLRAMSWVPADSAAHAASLATVVLAVIQLLVLHAACRAWGARPIAATLAVAIYAAAPLVVRYSTEAEAFAGNQLVVALVLWLAAEQGPLRGNRRAFVLGLVAGLGMTNHLTCTLIAPVGLLGVLRGARERDHRRAVAVVAAAAGWLVGLLPYLYLFTAPDNLMSWPNPTDLGELFDIVLRRAYGGAFGFSGTGEPVPVAAQLGELASMLGRSWMWIAVPVGLGALVYRIARPASDTRAGWLALAVSFLLAGPLLALRFDVPTEEFGLHIVHRFHLLPILMLAVPVAVGITVIGEWLPSRGDDVRRQHVLELLVHLGFLALLATSIVDVARYRTPAMEYIARNTLRSMPPDAVIMAATADELDVGIRYLQLTRGERPDVLFFRWRDAVVPWYRAKLVPHGLALPPGTAYSGPAAIDMFHARGRPVFVFWGESELRAEYPSYPFGVLVRLLPRGAAVPAIGDVFAQNRELFERFDLGYPLPGKRDQFATWVHRKYVGTWVRLADALEAAGMPAEAATALELARALNPVP